MKNSKKNKSVTPRGPKPDHLKIEGMKWGDAVGKALQKKRPPEGWPKPEKKPKKKK